MAKKKRGRKPKPTVLRVGKPRGRKPRLDPTRCICGRNLCYPAKVTEKAILCRCGRRHKKLKEVNYVETL